MFTGLIRGVGTIDGRRMTSGKGLVLAIRCPDLAEDFAIGDSVAVDGACLTITGLDGNRFDADVSAETLDRTTLGRLTIEDRVNLEPALRLGDRLGGHLVTGHVDGPGRIARRRKEGEGTVFSISVSPELMPLIVEKGSIAIDGISLTVNSVEAETFTVMVIPHTLEHTTLDEHHEGETVNLETDILGKYVARLLGTTTKDAPEGLTLDKLAENGFL